MAIEILTVSLSDEAVENIARRVAQLVRVEGLGVGVASTTQSEPPSPNFPQSAEPSGFPAQPDPWQNSNPTPPSQQQLSPTAQVMTGYQPPQQYQPPPAVQQGPPQRFCPHGEMRFVPAGTNNQGKSYNAFYGCVLQRGDPNQCKPQRV